MTPTQEAAMRQALEAMRRAVPTGKITLADWMKANRDLEAALEEPPVDDPHRDHWVAIAEAAQKIAASTECGLAEAKALCAALDRLTEAMLAESEERNFCPRCGKRVSGIHTCTPPQDEQERFCDTHCTWADHAPGCVRAWTDADQDAARLAMELEALLLDTKDMAALSRWWDSAHEALELHRQRLREAQRGQHP